MILGSAHWKYDDYIFLRGKVPWMEAKFGVHAEAIGHLKIFKTAHFARGCAPDDATRGTLPEDEKMDGLS